MMYIVSLFLFVAPLSAWLSPFMYSAENAHHDRSFRVHLADDGEDLSPQDRHARALTPQPVRFGLDQDERLTFQKKSINIAGQIITRTTPFIDGIAVENADGIFDDVGTLKQFFFTQFSVPKKEAHNSLSHISSSQASFLLSPAEAFERAIAEHGATYLIDPYVEKINGLYEKRWLLHFGELRPIYKIRLPTLSIFDLKDISVDASTGEVLLIEDVAQFMEAPADAFVYAPSTSHLNKAELKSVMLPNLIDVADNSFLTGEYMSVRTCCRYYTCPEEGPCTDDKKRCAMASHKNARQSRELLGLQSNTLGLDAVVNLPPVVYVDTVRCTYLPFARASKKATNSNVVGFFDKPIDEPGLASEMDRFSEIQAYYSMMSFFKNIRSLLENPAWCLRPEAMSCNSDGSPVLDENGLPQNPYRVFVNQLIPDMKLNNQTFPAPDNFIAQATNGKGSRENPVVLNDFIRFSNAAFIPAMATLKPETLRADEFLSDLIKPYDHNVFFQGERDFAYDGDVVFHEFMHAITTSLISKINSLGLDQWGIHSEPGSLNEAWSDYFAAAFTNDSKVGLYANVQGGYGEVALRNIDNNASCPADVIGEIHNDGLIWSGALWEIRTRIKNELSTEASIQFDRAVLASLAQAKNTEDFKTQSEKLITNLKTRAGLGDKAVAIAEEIFKKRGVRDCFRAVTLSSVDKNNLLSTTIKPMLFVPSKNQIKLQNYAPSTSQIEIGVPAGAKSITLTWRQFLGANGALLGTESTPETTPNMVPLSLIAHKTTPIVWQFKNARAVATDGEKEINATVENATFSNGLWQYTMALDLDRCEQQTWYLSLLSNDFKYVLQNLSVKFDVDTNVDRSDCDYTGTLRGQLTDDDLGGCSTHHATNLHFVFFAIFALRFVVSRRQKRFVS